MIELLAWIILGVLAVYLLIGLAHASAISSDKFLRPGDFLYLMLLWPWKGSSWL